MNTSIIKCEMKLLIHSQTSTVQPLKFGNGQVISSHTLLGMWLLIHAGLKLIHVSNRGPSGPIFKLIAETWLNKRVQDINTLIGNKLIDHSDVAGALPVGATPTTSSFFTWHLASMDWAKTTARRDKKHLSFGILCDLYKRFDDSSPSPLWCAAGYKVNYRW